MREPLGIVCELSVPDNVVLPATVNPVPFNNCKLSDRNLAVIVFVPALTLANSKIPSSVPAEASCILPVIFA